MRTVYLNPTQLLIHLLGPSKAETARKLGISRQNLDLWLRPRKTIEAGIVPSVKHKHVLNKAAEYNVELSTNDLIFGRKINE